MGNTSPNELAARLLDRCLGGRAWSYSEVEDLTRWALDPDELLALAGSRALFGVLVEGLADRFEPALCDAYAAIFSHVLSFVIPEFDAEALQERYRAVRTVRPAMDDPEIVVVLSRVTLGADVAVTSIILDAVRQRFPNARIQLAGSKKAYELFEMNPRIEHLHLPYGRTAALADRLSVWPQIRTELSAPGTLVIDPDSRLTQLGLLPVCAGEQHHLFESRGYGGEGKNALPVLARRWARETLGVQEAEPWLAPRIRVDFGGQPLIACSLGVGENPAKRLPDPFEADLFRMLAKLPAQVLVDLGAGGEEARRVRAAVEAAGVPEGRIGFHEGSFASFASIIAQSRLYVGYDSAGQHVAAALGIPLVCFFAGAVCDRMFHRWSPEGPGPRTILRVEGQTQAELLDRAAQAAREQF